MKYFRNALRFGALACGGAFASTAAFAVGTPLDVTAVTDSMTAQLSSITLVGAGILGVVVLIAAIAWVRRPIH
jgi:hypothetical protein